MTNRKPEEYTFANAYIGSYVKEMMSQKDLNRLASCKNLNTAATILQEFGYSESPQLEEGNVESFIKQEKEQLTERVYSTLSDREALNFFLFPYDYHNAKVCLKAEFLGTAVDPEFMAQNGCFNQMQMASMIRDRNFIFMSVSMKQAITEAADLFGRGNDPQEIDLILDKACYKDMLQAADKTKEPFLVGMVRLQIDITNLKTFIRLRQIEKPWSFFQKVFLEGGNIAEQFFISGYEEPYTQLADRLAPYGLKKAMSEGGARLKETGQFGIIEKLCDDAVMEYNRKEKYESFGIAPIAAYWHGKNVELDNLRILLTGISIGLPEEQMTERLRDTYV